MNKKYYRNNGHRLHLIESDEIFFNDKKRVKKFRKDKLDKEDVRYNNSNKQ